MDRTRIAGFAGIVLCAGVAVMVSPVIADVPTTQPQDSNQQVRESVEAMQKRIDQMQSQLNQTQSKLEQTQSELAQQQNKLATPAPVPQDHTQPLNKAIGDSDRHILASTDSGMVAGFDPKTGFFLSSEDGSSFVHAGMLFQGQVSADLSKNRSLESTGIIQFDIDGNLFSRDLIFDFQLNQDNLGPAVEVAEGTYVFDKEYWNHHFAVEVGVFKNPVFKQSAGIADWNQLFVERALVEDQIGGGQYGQQIRGIAVQLLGNDAQPLRASLYGYDGDKPGGLAITPANAPNASIGTRADYKFWGHWDDTTDLTGVAPWRADLLDVGGGLVYENYESNHGIRLSIDGQYQVARQWTAFGALYYDHFDAGDGVVGSRNDFGFLFEGGYQVLPQLQVVARYDLTRISSAFELQSGRSAYNELGIGANYYLGPKGSWGNHAKVSLDMDYLPNGAPPNGVLYVANATGQFSVRGQVQLQF